MRRACTAGRAKTKTPFASVSMCIISGATPPHSHPAPGPHSPPAPAPPCRHCHKHSFAQDHARAAGLLSSAQSSSEGGRGAHADGGGRLEYRHMTAESLYQEGCTFDLVVCSEVCRLLSSRTRSCARALPSLPPPPFPPPFPPCSLSRARARARSLTHIHTHAGTRTRLRSRAHGL